MTQHRGPVAQLRNHFAIWMLCAVLATVTLAFLISRLGAVPTALDDLSQDQVRLLLPAILVSAIGVVGFGVVWSVTLNWLAGNSSPLTSLLRFFVYSAPARYIPGTLPYHATRVLFAERLGASKLAVTGSIAYEAILGLGAAVSVGVLGTATALGVSNSFGNPYLLALLPLAALPLLLQQRLLVPIANRILRVAGRRSLRAEALLSTGQAILVFAAYACVHCLNGLAFFLVIQSVTADAVHPGLAIGSYSLAAAAGVAVIFVPSGVGVREAVLVAALSGTLSTEDALVAAAAARAVSVLGEVALLALVGTTDIGIRLCRRNGGRLPAATRWFSRPKPAK